MGVCLDFGDEALQYFGRRHGKSNSLWVTQFVFMRHEPLAFRSLNLVLDQLA
jgi:hypothetical protein